MVPTSFPHFIPIKKARGTRNHNLREDAFTAADVDPTLKDDQSASEAFAGRWFAANPGRAGAGGRIVPWTATERAGHLQRLQGAYQQSGLDPEAKAGTNGEAMPQPRGVLDRPANSRIHDYDGGRDGLTTGDPDAPRLSLTQAVQPRGFPVTTSSANRGGSNTGGVPSDDAPDAQSFPIQTTPSPTEGSAPLLAASRSYQQQGGTTAGYQRGMPTYGKMSQYQVGANGQTPLPPRASVNVPNLDDGKPGGIYRNGQLVQQDTGQRLSTVGAATLDTADPNPVKGGQGPLPDNGEIDPLSGKPKRGSYAGPSPTRMV